MKTIPLDFLFSRIAVGAANIVQSPPKGVSIESILLRRKTLNWGKATWESYTSQPNSNLQSAFLRIPQMPISRGVLPGKTFYFHSDFYALEFIHNKCT